MMFFRFLAWLVTKSEKLFKSIDKYASIRYNIIRVNCDINASKDADVCP